MPQLPLRTVDVVIDTMRQELADTVWHTATCAVLAQRYHVGISTMRWALRQLVAEGALTMHQGKAPTQANTIDRESTSAEQLVTALTTGISDGRWRVGDPLPKIAALRLEFRCSNNTVMQACEQLIAHGVVHRSGRQIIIGHPLRISQRQMHADRLHDQPFVLIVGAQSRFWHFQMTTTMATFYNRLVK